VEVKNLHGAEAWLAETDHPALAAAARALKRSFGKTPVFMREGGSIRSSDVWQAAGVPAVLMGIGLPDDNLHAPNEKFDLDQFYRGNELPPRCSRSCRPASPAAPPRESRRGRPPCRPARRRAGLRAGPLAREGRR